VPFVVDASALVFAADDPALTARHLRQRLRDDTVHALHLIDAELGSALRRNVLRGQMRAQRAIAILSTYPTLIDHRHEHHGWLAAFAWQLRDNLSFYDALYVALAAALDIELVTLDARIAGAPNLPARVTVLGATRG
jgi:predicted nucleic acid-binding protein